ncbi:MAG TPA: DNA repair protein RecN [bacterium]|nr:DNA repair protein RecN [bacterium]
MLTALHIRDFAIIDELELSLGPGLNVMTGETGAGKTIIVEALKLVMGERADSSAIRAGRGKAAVTAIFDASSVKGTLRQALSDAGVDLSGDIIVHRVVAEGGRGRISVNGVPVTGAMLKNFAEHLVDVSSQHEHQILLDPAEHASIVDSFGGHEELFASYRESHTSWSMVSAELEKLRADELTAKERLDYLRFQARELEAAALKEGEEEKIEVERNLIKHAVVLEEKSRLAEGLLYGESGSALEEVDRAIELLTQCAGLDPSALSWKEALGRARAEIEEVARELAGYAEKLDSNPERLEELEERLHLIRSLAKKHGGSASSCMKRLREFKAEIAAIDSYDEVVAEKEESLAEAASKRRAAAAALSAARKKAGEGLGRAVSAELLSLGMGKVGFEAKITKRAEERWDDSGPELVEFLFSPNPGEPMRPLAKIASGGELSRVMLAVKSALSGRAQLAATSVFDEVDSGIGGAVAEVVGKKLKEVAKSRQVICITHLPQVAVHGDLHMRIAKRVEGGRTVASMERLSDEGRVDEIARMLGGRRITEKTLEHAREMLLSVRGASR